MIRLDVLDFSAWQQAWHDLPGDRREVYSAPEYHAVCAGWERATPQCLRAANGAGWMLYPYLDHPTEDGRHDAQTAYGYGGPLFVGEWSPEDRSAALNAAADRLRTAGAVAEFVRCHTEWLDAEQLAAAGYRVFQVRTNVECDLSRADFEDGWASAARRNLRKGRAAGLAWRDGASADGWAAFEQLYGATAERLEMAAGYRFDGAYFRGLSRLAGARLVLVEAADGQVVAGAVVFIGGRLAHYHLGASEFAHQEKRPNDFLYHAMATVARDAACERIVWGGGMSNDTEDTLFRFKTHFGSVRRPVFCAGRVIDAGAYDQLCKIWQARHSGRESKLFLKYRT